MVENYRETAKYVDETVIPAAKEAKEFVTVRPPLRPARLPLRGAAPQAAGSCDQPSSPFPSNPRVGGLQGTAIPAIKDGLEAVREGIPVAKENLKHLQEVVLPSAKEQYTHFTEVVVPETRQNIASIAEAAEASALSAPRARPGRGGGAPGVRRPRALRLPHPALHPAPPSAQVIKPHAAEALAFAKEAHQARRCRGERPGVGTRGRKQRGRGRGAAVQAIKPRGFRVLGYTQASPQALTRPRR